MTPFLSALVILIACLVYGWVHSWMASLSFKRGMERVLGVQNAARFYRLIFNIFATISLLPILAMVPLLPDHRLYAIPIPWAWLALAIQGLAALALLVGVIQTGLLDFIGLGQLARSSPATKPEMVTGGLYRWVRHPLYTAGLVFIWLSPIMSSNLLALFVGLSVYLVIGAYYEERKLAREYGEAYRRYQQETPMFIPRPPKRGIGV